MIFLLKNRKLVKTNRLQNKNFCKIILSKINHSSITSTKKQRKRGKTTKLKKNI